MRQSRELIWILEASHVLRTDGERKSAHAGEVYCRGAASHTHTHTHTHHVHRSCSLVRLRVADEQYAQPI